MQGTDGAVLPDVALMQPCVVTLLLGLGLALASATSNGLLEDGAPRADCWRDCLRTGFYCAAFCCQPFDSVGNPTCWDAAGLFTYDSCCRGLVDPTELPEPPRMLLGQVVLQLYRGPSDHNSPKTNERTLEVALGLWFLRRQLRLLLAEETGAIAPPLEVGNVMAMYWPRDELLSGLYFPWQVADLIDNGVDATAVSYVNRSVLSLSTIEHIGFDNEGGSRRQEGFQIAPTMPGYESWAASWDAAPSLLLRIAREAAEFLLTFPIGLNPRLDAVVSRAPELRRYVRVARRADAANRWEVDARGSFDYHYDVRDTYALDHVGHLYSEMLPEAYRRVYGEAMPRRPPFAEHPPFRFANAICIVTNVPELLA